MITAELNFLKQRLTTHAVNAPEGNTCPQLREFCLGGQKHTREEEKVFLSQPKTALYFYNTGQIIFYFN